MRVRQRQLGRILDRHHPLIGGDKARNRIEHRGLAATGAAADENIAALAHCQLQQAGHAFVHGAEINQILDPQRIIAKLAYGYCRPVQRQRLDHHIDTATVRQARIDHGRGFIEAAAQRGDDATHDAQHMSVVGEVQGLLLQNSLARNKDALVTVDQNVFHFRICHQVIQRPQPRQFLVQGLCNPLHLLVIDGKALLTHKLLQLLVHKLAHTTA